MKWNKQKLLVLVAGGFFTTSWVGSMSSLLIGGVGYLCGMFCLAVVFAIEINKEKP